MMPGPVDTSLPLQVYLMFGVLVGCLLTVHYLIYRHVRRLERHATPGAEGVIPVERGELVGIERLEAALARDPRRADLVEILAHVYYCRRDLPRALDAYHRALDEDPDSEMTHFYLGNVYFLSHEPERARVHWLRVVEIAPGSTHARWASERLEKVR
jgi:tetratricopeptide (TPR) repeat protein